MSDFKQQLAREFADDASYREEYADSHSRTIFTAQIKAVRQQRNLSQEALAELIDSTQTRISLYEDPDYGGWKLDTLRRIARRLGCWLRISIESYGMLLHEAEHLKPAKLLRHTFEDDPEIQRWLAPVAVDAADAYAPTRRLVTEWLGRVTEDYTPLCDWLQGLNLPEYQPDRQPAEWLLHALPASTDLRRILAQRLAQLFEERQIDQRPIGWRPKVLLENAFIFAAQLGHPEILQPALDAVFRRAQDPDSIHLERSLLGALRLSMERNQADGRWEAVWQEFVEKNSHTTLPGRFAAGFEGLLYLGFGEPHSEYWERLARAIHRLERRLYQEGGFGPETANQSFEQLRDCVERIYAEHNEPATAVMLAEGALRAGWSQAALAVWAAANLAREWDQSMLGQISAEQQQKLHYMMAAGLDSCSGWEPIDVSREAWHASSDYHHLQRSLV